MAVKAEVRSLTGLRGLAALAVALYHVNPELNTAPFIGRFVGKGYLAVDVFFVLSGFVLALNYADGFAAGWSRERHLAFLLRRVARLYPLYLFLLVAFAIAGGLIGPTDAAPMPQFLPPAVRAHPVELGAANLLMIQSWGFGPSIDGTAWSLSAEWAAYLLFPLLAAGACFGRPRHAAILGLAASTAIIATALLTGRDGEMHSGPLDAYSGATIEPLLRCLGGFTIGLLSFRLAQIKRLRRFLAQDASIALVSLLLFAFLALRLDDLAIYPLFPLLILGLYGNDGAAGRFFGARPLHWLGLVSYSIYLLHPLWVAPKQELETLLHSVMPLGMADAGASLAAYATILVASALAFHLIEAPGRRWLNRVVQTRRRATRRPASSRP